jgi:hypothetical protein
MPGWSTIARPTLPSPITRLNTPGSAPAVKDHRKRMGNRRRWRRRQHHGTSRMHPGAAFQPGWQWGSPGVISPKTPTACDRLRHRCWVRSIQSLPVPAKRLPAKIFEDACSPQLPRLSLLQVFCLLRATGATHFLCSLHDQRTSAIKRRNVLQRTRRTMRAMRPARPLLPCRLRRFLPG